VSDNSSSATPAALSGKNQLQQVLGGGFAIAAGVGTIIGLGILRTPGEIAAVFSNPWIYVGLWIAVGLFVLMSTAVVTELVGMNVRSGGYYVLVKKALGPYPGFVIGWIDWLCFGAVIALKTTVLVEYIALLIPAADPWQKVLAVAITSVFAILQLRGVLLAGAIQRYAAAGMGLIIVGLTLALILADPVNQALPDAAVQQTGGSAPGLTAYGLVLAAIVFTYDGWLMASYFGGEIVGGGAAVARACIRGVLIILLLYVTLNAALAFTVPLEQLAGQELALAHALGLTWGEGAGTFVLLAAILILLTHQNGNYMTAPRALYALSLDGLGTDRATAVGRGNPVFAVLLTWVLAVSLIVVGGFEFLLNMSALFFVVLYLALLFGVLRLRKTQPLADRPYRAWGHPYSTTICVAGWTLISLFMAYTAPESFVSALIMTACSLPIYAYLVRWRRLNLING